MSGYSLNDVFCSNPVISGFVGDFGAAEFFDNYFFEYSQSKRLSEVEVCRVLPTSV